MKQEYKALGSFGTLGLEIALSILFGAYGGYWLDGKFGTAPWLLCLGFFFGCGAAGKAIHRNLKEMQKQTAQEEKEQGNPAPIFEKPEPERDDDERKEVKADDEQP